MKNVIPILQVISMIVIFVIKIEGVGTRNNIQSYNEYKKNLSLYETSTQFTDLFKDKCQEKVCRKDFVAYPFLTKKESKLLMESIKMDCMSVGYVSAFNWFKAENPYNFKEKDGKKCEN